MKCDKCGFENEENSKYCSNCGNKLIKSETTKETKNKLKQNTEPFDNNYKKIFNICFYSVIGCVAFIVFLSFFIYLNWFGFIGTILDIFLNIWIWVFLIFIFIFRKNHKVWSLVVSIIFGLMTIIGALGSIINPVFSQVLQ